MSSRLQVRPTKAKPHRSQRHDLRVREMSKATENSPRLLNLF